MELETLKNSNCFIARVSGTLPRVPSLEWDRVLILVGRGFAPPPPPLPYAREAKKGEPRCRFSVTVEIFSDRQLSSHMMPACMSHSQIGIL